MQTLTQLQSFARELMAFDWYYSMSDDSQVWRRGNAQEQKFALVAATLGHSGQRLYDLAKSYFCKQHEGQATGDEWRFVGALLWVYGIKETEDKLKSYVTDKGLIRFDTLRTVYPSEIFQTW